MILREVKQYALANDWLPLHPDFYSFVDKDDKGYFIKDKDGNRWDIRLIAEESV